jgi:hypothetical protein
MPADTLTISFTGPLADEIRAAAEAAGLTPDEYVNRELAETLAAYEHDDEDLSWDEDMRRLEEPGENVPLDEAMDRFKSKIAEARAKTK